MNTRIEEIVNAIEHNKLAADDSFRFHCTQCGECCINREDILLTPLDLFRMPLRGKSRTVPMLCR